MWIWKTWGEWEYVHRGTDSRAGGFIGQILAMIQTLGSFRSTKPPKRLGWSHFALFWPPFIGIAVPWDEKDDGIVIGKRLATFRAGWRWDPHWETGGYILDVIIKMRETAIPFVVILTISMLSACGAKKSANVVPPAPEIKTVVVKEPVPIRITPPPELLEPINAPIPVFISPLDPSASSALDVQGERDLRSLLERLYQRIRALELLLTTAPVPVVPTTEPSKP